MRPSWIAPFVAGCSLLLSASDTLAGQSAEAPRPCVAQDLVQALVSGDDARAGVCTKALLSGEFQIGRAEIEDKRQVAPGVLLRATREDGWDLQLGINTVGEYVMCALEIEQKISSRRILREVAPDLLKRCGDNICGCEVCNSQVCPVPDEVVARLREYWLRRLGLSS